MIPVIRLAHEQRNMFWWYGIKDWTFQPITHLQSANEQMSKKISSDMSVHTKQKCDLELHILSFFDACSVFTDKNIIIYNGTRGGKCILQCEQWFMWKNRPPPLVADIYEGDMKLLFIVWENACCHCVEK